MKKVKIYLDMDGTIADLYGASHWLERVRAEEDGVFSELKPFITEELLLQLFPQHSYEIHILSMTPLNASKTFCEKVCQEKDEWLDKYFPNITKRIYKPYGKNKNLKNSINAILIDDNEEIRNNWRGLAINPSSNNEFIA